MLLRLAATTAVRRRLALTSHSNYYYYQRGSSALLFSSSSLLSSSSTVDDEDTTNNTKRVLQLDTLIVGGGLAGLATGAALQAIANVQPVHIVEARNYIECEDNAEGAAIQLGPNAFKAFDQMGGRAFVDDIYQAGSRIDQTIMLLPNNRPMLTLPNTAYDDTGYPIVLIRWCRLQALLRELVRTTATTHTSTDRESATVMSYDEKYATISGYLQQKGTINTTTNNRSRRRDTTTVYPIDAQGYKVPMPTASSSSSASSFYPRLIIGADGLHSVFRQRIQQQQQNKAAVLKDNGRLNIKAVVAMDLQQLMNQEENQYEEQDTENVEGAASSSSLSTYAQFLEGQVAAFAGPAGTKHTYWAISVPDEASSETDGTSTKQFLADIDYKKDKHTAKQLLLEKLQQSSNTANENNKNEKDTASSSSSSWIIKLVEQTDPDTILFDRSMEATVQPHDSFVSNDGHIVLVGDAA